MQEKIRLRLCLGGVLVFLILVGWIRADEFKGSIKKWDVAKKSLTVSIAGKNQACRRGRASVA
ncbi:MAG TPA: hypothetical protein VEL76_35445 [Gemmataceae bacterium]|nr:hypothetical protein [Gemmataceae bacterium]